MRSGSTWKRAAVGLLAILLCLAAWQFVRVAQDVNRAAAAGRLPADRFDSITTRMPYTRVQALLGSPDLASDVYRDRDHLIQCWYYDLRSTSHLEVCFDHWRVYYKDRYQ